MSDWAETPEARAWLRRADAELVPMIQDSAATVSIVPSGETDIKFAVELGLSIMLDKPIILAVMPGAKIPDHLSRVADKLLEFDPADPSLSPRIKAALDEVLGSSGEKAGP